MQVEKEEIQFWLAVNDEGQKAVSFDGAAEAIGLLVNEHGGAAIRTVKMAVLMALPTNNCFEGFDSTRNSCSSSTAGAWILTATSPGRDLKAERMASGEV